MSISEDMNRCNSHEFLRIVKRFNCLSKFCAMILNVFASSEIKSVIQKNPPSSLQWQFKLKTSQITTLKLQSSKLLFLVYTNTEQNISNAESL